MRASFLGFVAGKVRPASVAAGALLLVGCRSSHDIQYLIDTSKTNPEADRQHACRVLRSVASRAGFTQLAPAEVPTTLVYHDHSPVPRRLVYFRLPATGTSCVEINANFQLNLILVDLERVPRKPELAAYDATHRALSSALNQAFPGRVFEKDAEQFW